LWIYGKKRAFRRGAAMGGGELAGSGGFRDAIDGTGGNAAVSGNRRERAIRPGGWRGIDFFFRSTPMSAIIITA